MSTRKPPFDTLLGQPRVSEFLETAVASNRVSHAYLFLGKPGSGKTDAAYAFAKAILCESGGCNACDTCIRIARRTHPDVHCIAPEGAAGYMVGQIRDLVHDVNLAPIRAKKKIYVIDRADLLQGASANAFLKTLEEPPVNTVFLLLGRIREAILPTVLSRCQVVPFRTIPVNEAMAMLASETGCSEEDARIALAASGASISRARDFLLSSSRKAVRKEILAVIGRLSHADDLDVLDGARRLVEVLKQPLGEVKAAQEQELKDNADYLAKSVLKILEERHKRELSARERQGMQDLFSITHSWLRDCLLITNKTVDLVVNSDDYASIARVATRSSASSITRAIQAVSSAASFIPYNVSPQLVIENMLFDIREVLKCQI